MRPPALSAASRGQRGVTLIEVLVTMVVIALGLLGFAGLQTVTMKSNRAALYHSYATMYAYDIIDCMRANRAAALKGNYNIAISASAPSSPSTVAQRDIHDWLTTLGANLPSGDGAVTVSSANGAVTIDVQWDEGAATVSTFSTRSSLRP